MAGHQPQCCASVFRLSHHFAVTSQGLATRRFHTFYLDLKLPGTNIYVDNRVILVNMVISVILGHEKTKIQNILDLGKIDVFSVRTNIYIKNKKMGHLI